MPDVTVRDAATASYQPSTQIHQAVLAVCWPDGRPCFQVEMFLLDVASRYTVRRLDGGSLRVLASQLSLLVRFCWKKRLQLWSMDDGHMREAVAGLQSESHPRRPGKQRRNSNTVNQIIATWVAFFMWLQTQPGYPPRIVGLIEEQPQIQLVWRRSIDRFGRVRQVLRYRYGPASSTPEEVKGPISRVLKQRLWEGSARMSDPLTKDERYRHRFDSEKEFLAECEYLLKRRQLILDLLECTGARPGELVRLTALAHRRCSENRHIVLTTLKRRKLIDPQRSVPADAGTAVRVELFIHKYRQPLLARLRRQGLKPEPKNHLFLTVKGSPMTEAALEREFRRIVEYAGLEDERACMSMFRHRYITNMVKLHLLAFLENNPDKRRFSMQLQDYRGILKSVATLTGHGDELSLLRYIDLGWEELGVFDYVPAARTLINAVEQGMNRLAGLATALRPRRDRVDSSALRSMLEELESIRREVSDALDAVTSTC
ncbi:tyrosine-type recombinase/integrase [Paraburkholderia sp. 32]|uniref:tyrosine-type recombinase/integrase n=1 Tax=Paraburkholderia sp. 32 TaxID=2991057 RepID=UPI003D260F58